MVGWLKAMSETSFPISDLMRRQFQTAIVIISLTLCCASTLFLLLFGEKLGFEITLVTEQKMTASFSVIFSNFTLLMGILVFVAGAIIVSFMVFMMMSQRVRDVGLMKGAGCPNDLTFGYFMTELLIIALAGCILGTILGMVTNLASNSLFSILGLEAPQQSIDFWLVLLVSVSFFVLTLGFGIRPILNATRVEPAKALSPSFHMGLSKDSGFKPMSNFAVTAKLAGRGLIRRKSATFRIAASLIVVFVLATVAIAGGVIANQTTKSWVEKAIGRNVIVIGHQEMCAQYEHLLLKFQESNESSDFNYTLEKYQLPENLSEKLNSLGLNDVDARIIFEEQVQELPGYMFDPNGTTYSVGDSHTDTSVVVGIDPKKVVNDWFVDGVPLKEADDLRVMVGDSLAQKIFTSPLNQSIMVHTDIFGIASVCLDPLNSGKVVYVPIESLKTAANISEPNLILVKVDTDNHLETLNQIKAAVKGINSEFDAIDLNAVLDKNLGFLSYIWSTMMLLPLFSLVAASLCLIGYVILAIAEERREFGVLRALGASPMAVIKIVSVQLLTVLLSCFAAGVSLGIILTLMILIPEPMVTTYTVLEIAGWLMAALTVMFLIALYPAVRFSRKPVLEAIGNP